MASALGDFLRARREHAPAPTRTTARRRTPGLRREEVAARATVSADYYVRLEQGRECNPSDAVLEALGDALAFSDDDRAHVRALRDGVPGIPAQISDERRRRMEMLVAAQRPNPAYVIDRRRDVVAINPEGADLFDGLVTGSDRARPNTCRYLLTDPRARERFVDWATVARISVAGLRQANADSLDDPELVALVRELSSASEEFEQLWNAHAVARRRSDVKRFRAEDGSVASYPYEIAHLSDGLRMTVYLVGGKTVGE